MRSGKQADGVWDDMKKDDIIEKVYADCIKRSKDVCWLLGFHWWTEFHASQHNSWTHIFNPSQKFHNASDFPFEDILNKCVSKQSTGKLTKAEKGSEFPIGCLQKRLRENIFQDLFVEPDPSNTAIESTGVVTQQNNKT